MAERSKIEWCDATWNVMVGCTKATMPGPEGKLVLREGCRNCYAIREGAKPRLQQFPQYRAAVTTGLKPEWTGKITLVENKLEWPVLRRKEPLKIFVNAFSDLFHESLDNLTIGRVFEVIHRHPQHTFMVLTKRPKRMEEYMVAEYSGAERAPRNLWLGVSVEDQASVEYAIPFLLRAPAAIRWLSAEPLLGPLNLKGDYPLLLRAYTKAIYGGAIDWVVVGGESGPGARPMKEEWALSVVRQCRDAEVAAFFKQGSQANWKHYKDFDSFPPELQVREYPEVA